MKLRLHVLLLWFALLALSALSCAHDRSPALSTSGAAEGASATEVPRALWAAYVASVQRRAPEEYQFKPTARGFHAESARQGLRSELHAEGVEVTSSAGSWSFHAGPSRWGCDGELMEVEPAEPEAEDNRATYRRTGFDEWYVNGPLGLEQGFTLAAPPSCRKARGTRVVIELAGGLDATVSEKGKEAVLRDATGRAVLRYADLYVIDSTGKELPAELVSRAGRLSVQFEDGEAVYPVTVDPLMWVEEGGPLIASDGAPGDYFGISAALSGDTAVIGTLNKGAVYVFVRSGASWFQQAELTASDGATGVNFGFSVAVSGDTAVVGAYGKEAAYVFVRSGASWSQQQKLIASDGAAGDFFGFSVALNGDTAVVGARQKATAKGVAYVFVRSGASWSLQQTLLASDGAADDYFGQSVAISGDTAIVGAWGKGSQAGAAYVFARSGAFWSQQQKLTASDSPTFEGFGYSVAVDGNTAVVGTGGYTLLGAAYVFVRAGASWSQQAQLLPSDGPSNVYFGDSVTVTGDTAVIGDRGKASGKGSAYVFVRSGSSWTQQQELTTNDNLANDQFGNSVAMSGNAVIVGAYMKASDQGAAYVFVLPGAPCAQADDCANGWCVDGVCCSVPGCTAADECHEAGTCQPDTGVCSNPAKPDGETCSIGTCQAGTCTPPPDAGPDSGTGGASTTTTGPGGSSTGGAGGAGGKPSEATIDLSCRFGVPDGTASTRAAWLGVLALLALRRRRGGHRHTTAQRPYI